MEHRRRYQILVCRGPECGDKRGSSAIYRAFRDRLASSGATVELGWQSCFGRCTQGPNVLVREVTAGGRAAVPALAAPRRAAGARTALYNGVSVAHVEQIIQGHLVAGRVLRHLVKRPLRAPDGEPE